MKFLPVVVRELRAEARNPYNYWLRVVAAGIAVAIFLIVTAQRGQRADEIGSQLFSGLNGLTFLTIALLAPMLTADCLSREKREGTLGLLFLTPLTASGIVTAKSLIHALRSLSLVLAVLPITAVVFLMGGITWRELMIAALVNFDVLLLGLGAGVLASAISKVWSRSIVLALMLALVFCLGFIFATLFWFLSHGAGSLSAAIDRFEWANVFAFCFGVNGLNLTARGLDDLLMRVGITSLVAWAFFALILTVAAGRIKTGWQDEPLTVRQKRWQDFFCTPRFAQSLFRRRMRAALDKNPIGWLQQYSWSARISKWGWCVVIIVLETWLVTISFYQFEEWQPMLIVMLLLGMSFSAANSFIRERRSGAMELILVTPLSYSQIIFGRIKGVWAQFVPAVIIMILSVTLGVQFRRSESTQLVVVFFVSSFAILPIIGLDYSLRQKSFIGAWLLTGFTGLLLPFVLSGVTFLALLFGLGFSFFPERAADGFWCLVMFWQVVIACRAGLRLRRKLEDRTFAVNLA